MNKEDRARESIIEAHKGLANVYRHRMFQYIRPEFCIKLETSTEKHGTMEFYVQLLGYYHDSLPGIVIYKKFEDYLSMIYNEQTIDNLAAVKRAELIIVFLAKNYKSTNGVKSDRKRETKHSSYASPQSRVSASHWGMIKHYDVCAKNEMNPKLPMIPCFTPRLDKLTNPKETLRSLIWITQALENLYYTKIKSNEMQIDSSKHKFVLEDWKSDFFITFPYGLDLMNAKQLSLRPWLKTLPYIFNTMKTCGDGLTYFEKKLNEAQSKLILRKVSQDSYFLDPSGIDFVTAIKGLSGVYMKMAILDGKYYDVAVNQYLNKALIKDTRDTLKCRNLKLKCLLYSHKYKEYLTELKKEKFYDEKKVHRIDGTLSWNVTFCNYKLYGNKNEKTVESVKKSIQNHSNILYVLISIKGRDCKNVRNQRDLARYLSYYYEYGHFWMSQYSVFQFIVHDVLYYYLDSKSRAVHQFLSSSNRAFDLAKCPILNEKSCINTNCPNKHKCDDDEWIKCKLCHTAFFCSEECQDVCMKHKKHAIECEIIKKIYRVYHHFVDNASKKENAKGSQDEKQDMKEHEAVDENSFVWGEQEDNSLAVYMEELQEKNASNASKKKTGANRKEKKKRKSIENVAKGKKEKSHKEKASKEKASKKKDKKTRIPNKRRRSVELVIDEK